jgi:RNA polymerase-binding protein DksA
VTSSVTKKATPGRGAAKAASTSTPAAKKVAPVKKSTPSQKATKQTKAAAKKVTPAKKTTATKAAAKKAPATKSTAKKAAATKSPAKKTPAKKTPGKKTPAAQAPATKVATKAAPVKKTPATKAPATKAPAQKAPAKKTTVKKATVKKAPAKKAATKSPTALAVKADEKPWTVAELHEVRTELSADVERLQSELDLASRELDDLMRDAGDGAGNDQADVGSTTFERDHEMSLANNARDMLTQTQHALERIDDGTYGVCENCGQPIGKNRLMAFPRATLCLTCKQREERR